MPTPTSRDPPPLELDDEFEPGRDELFCIVFSDSELSLVMGYTLCSGAFQTPVSDQISYANSHATARFRTTSAVIFTSQADGELNKHKDPSMNR